jgi:hypothetical protein
MFEITYLMQMPSGILMFEVDLMVTELEDGQAFDVKGMKEDLIQWWEDPEAPRRTPEEACLGAWSTITDFIYKQKSHPRVQCSRVALETSGHKVKFTPTEDVWRKIYV